MGLNSSQYLKRDKTYTEAQLKFLEAMGGEAKGNPTKAKRIAGYSENSPVTTIVGALKDELIDLANSILVLNATSAAFGLVGLLNEPDQLGARNKVNVASTILDRVGIVKKEQVTVSAEGASIFILPAKN